MALNFPDSPTLNQIYTDTTSGFSYQWNGTVWISFTPASTRNIKTLDDISGSFNGSTQTFALTSASGPITPANSQSVIINLGGVVQDPSDDYTVSGSNIIFTTPPASGLSFSGVVLGVAVPVGISTGDAYYRQVYTPVGVQTSFNFVNGYTVGYLDVYHNGAKLVPVTDYTATDGLNFSLITAAQSGDVVEAIGYRVSTFGVGNGNLNSLTVSGISSFAGQTNITSGLNVTGVTTVGSNLNVTGVTTVGSNLNVSGNLNITETIISNNINNSGIGTFTFVDSFYQTEEKIISVNTSIANGQENISFAGDLVIGAGVTFTVSTGTTVRMNGLGEIDTKTVYVRNDLSIPNGTTSERPDIPISGSFRYNSDANLLEFYDGVNWRGVFLSGPLVQSPASVGVFGGGTTGTLQNVLDYITIASTGNATDFGDLLEARASLAACSSSTRGVFGGGGSSPTLSNVREYITIATTGNTLDFGDLTIARQNPAACSSSTRGVFGGGYSTTNVIDYITIASVGNATDFGDLTVARRGLAACSSSTRGVFGAGFTPTPTSTRLNTIDYITIATTGNATDFGDLTIARQNPAACSSSTRGVFGGGYTPTPALLDTLDYITIATTGNAIDFGDLTQTVSSPARAPQVQEVSLVVVVLHQIHLE